MICTILRYAEVFQALKQNVPWRPDRNFNGHIQTEIGMASAKSGCRYFAWKGSVGVAGVKDSGPRGTIGTLTAGT